MGGINNTVFHLLNSMFFSSHSMVFKSIVLLNCHNNYKTVIIFPQFTSSKTISKRLVICSTQLTKWYNFKPHHTWFKPHVFNTSKCFMIRQLTSWLRAPLYSSVPWIWKFVESQLPHIPVTDSVYIRFSTCIRFSAITTWQNFCDSPHTLASKWCNIYVEVT